MAGTGLVQLSVSTDFWFLNVDLNEVGYGLSSELAASFLSIRCFLRDTDINSCTVPYRTVPYRTRKCHYYSSLGHACWLLESLYNAGHPQLACVWPKLDSI